MKTALITAIAAIGVATCACSAQGQATPQATVTVTATQTAPASTQATPVTAATPSAPAQPAAAPPSAAPQITQAASTAAPCLSRYLYAKPGLGQGTTSKTYMVIEFKNLDNHPCTLYGYPGVAFGAGTPVHQVGPASTEDPSTPRKLVTLPAYGYANALLQIVHWQNYPAGTCNPVSVQWLQVIPPNQTVPLYMPYHDTACKSVRLLTVDAVRPGKGGSV